MGISVGTGGALSGGMRLLQGVVSGEAMNEFKNSEFKIKWDAKKAQAFDKRQSSFVEEMKSKNITK